MLLYVWSNHSCLITLMGGLSCSIRLVCGLVRDIFGMLGEYQPRPRQFGRELPMRHRKPNFNFFTIYYSNSIFKKIQSFSKKTQFHFFLEFQILNIQSSTINTSIFIHYSPHSNLLNLILLAFLAFHIFLYPITKAGYCLVY